MSREARPFSFHEFDREPIRRYLVELGYDVDPLVFVDVATQRPSTLCYLVRDGKLLMLRRRKEPFAEHWTAPGGKLEPGETPLEAVRREMWEETGLSVSGLSLRVVCAEQGGEKYDWLLFVFRAEHHEGEVTESDEGELRWAPIAELDDWKLPEVDRIIMRLALDQADEPYVLKVRYAADHGVDTYRSTPMSEFLNV